MAESSSRDEPYACARPVLTSPDAVCAARTRSASVPSVLRRANSSPLVLGPLRLEALISHRVPSSRVSGAARTRLSPTFRAGPALVAQGIEHRFPKPCVACSNHAEGAKASPGRMHFLTDMTGSARFVELPIQIATLAHPMCHTGSAMSARRRRCRRSTTGRPRPGRGLGRRGNARRYQRN